MRDQLGITVTDIITFKLTVRLLTISNGSGSSTGYTYWSIESGRDFDALSRFHAGKPMNKSEMQCMSVELVI